MTTYAEAIEQALERFGDAVVMTSGYDEDAEAAAFLIGARVGHKLNSTTKARATTKLLEGLRSEIVNLRGLAEEMRGLALEAGRMA